MAPVAGPCVRKEDTDAACPLYQVALSFHLPRRSIISSSSSPSQKQQKAPYTPVLHACHPRHVCCDGCWRNPVLSRPSPSQAFCFFYTKLVRRSQASSNVKFCSLPGTYSTAVSSGPWILGSSTECTAVNHSVPKYKYHLV